MAIKGVIFDLDDTLFDCTGQLVEAARRRAAAALAAATGQTEDAILGRMVALGENPREDVLDKLLDEFPAKGREKLLEEMNRAYNKEEVEQISLFPGVADTLKLLKKKYTLILVTSGIRKRQERKIEMLGIGKLFDHMFIHDIEKGENREALFAEALNQAGLRAEETVSVGDRVFSEIKICNRLGMNTVQMLHGKFKSIQPKSELEEPDYRISTIPEIFKALAYFETGKSGPVIVAVGGGTGLPNVLRGLKNYTDNLTAIVTVTDSGRNSGKLRKELGILPPGDIRNCLVALSESDELMKRLFQYRFDAGDLEGASLGNLLIAGLAKMTGSFEKALEEAGKILKIRGRVLPSTYTDVHICAELEDGQTMEEEMNVRKLNKAPITTVFLKPSAPEAAAGAVEAIMHADLIVLGPGSFYTSILPNVLVHGIREAICRSPAKKVYVANIMTQPGQTDGLSFSQHVNTLENYLGCPLDVVLVNNTDAPKKLVELYKKEGAELVVFDREKLNNKNVKIIPADLLENLSGKRTEWQKEDFLRHDPEKLGKAVAGLA